MPESLHPKIQTDLWSTRLTKDINELYLHQNVTEYTKKRGMKGIYVYPKTNKKERRQRK